MVSLAYQLYWLQSITGYRELLVKEKTNGFFVQQEKRWSTLKQVFIVSSQGSAIIQMTMCTCSTLQATGRISSQPVMRDSGTSSTHTAGCGPMEIQQGLPVKQDYRLQRVAGDTQQGYWLQSVAGSGVLPVTERSAVPILTGKKPASNPVLTTVSPVTEDFRFLSVAGYRELMVIS